MRTTGCAGTVAAALLVGLVLASPSNAQLFGDTFYTGADVQRLVKRAEFARSQGNCTRFRAAVDELRYIWQYPTTTRDIGSEEAIGRLMMEGCPKGTGTYVPPLLQITPFTLSGVSVGFHAGGTSGRNELVNPSGPSFGVQGGYGFTSGSIYVGGETRFNFGGVPGSNTGFGITERQRQNWSVSFLGRAGVVTPAIIAPAAGAPIVYVTAGRTWVSTRFSISGPGFHESDTKVLSGFVWGGGVAIPTTENTSVGIQYLNTRLASGAFLDGTVVNGATRTNTVLVNFNYYFGPLNQRPAGVSKASDNTRR